MKIYISSCVNLPNLGIIRRDRKEEKISYLEPVLLNIRGFTTLGSGDWYSRNNFFRVLFTLEGLLGWIMLGIFMATITNLLTRS